MKKTIQSEESHLLMEEEKEENTKLSEIGDQKETQR